MGMTYIELAARGDLLAVRASVVFLCVWMCASIAYIGIGRGHGQRDSEWREVVALTFFTNRPMTPLLFPPPHTTTQLFLSRTDAEGHDFSDGYLRDIVVNMTIAGRDTTGGWREGMCVYVHV